MTDSLDRVAVNVHTLVDPYQHREELDAIAARILGHKVYVQQLPPLLVQLRQAIVPGTDDDQPGLRSACASRPPASEDALDALIRIESAVAWWLTQEFKRSLRGIVEANLRALVGAATEPGRTLDQLQDLAYETSRWVAWAETEAGWRVRPSTVPDPAPCCDRRHALKVRRPADYAWCTNCGTAWSEHHPDLPSVLLLEQALMARRAAVA
jgi:hypothetical protein